MKNIVTSLSIVLLFNSYLSLGQECQKVSDPFTNEPVISFEWKAGGIRTLFYESRNGKSTLEIRLGELGAVEYVIPKGSEILFKLENGDVIKLVTVLDSRSVVSSTTINESNNMTSSTYFLKMEITGEQLKQLAKFKVSNMQIPDLHGGIQTYGIKELRNKFERFLFEGAKCLSDII
ncbi:MAG TPA: hypothetical protein PLJ60_16375 [Chryseolinea sp.]|nr:hypothetical protein [Chryseolinea sp.]HPM31913.1 hypothetical protein [Chryseolinea sp.]